MIRSGRTTPRVVAMFGLLLAGSLLAGSAAPVAGHAPDPVMGGELYAQDDRLEYRWRSGQVPPAWMQGAIHDAAAGSNDTRASRAAAFAYAADGPSPISYGEPSGCGTNGIACFSRAGAPNSFVIAFRRQGHVFDWGSMRWCQAYETPPGGCYDVENVTLDELGHVLILGHHDNYQDDSDYTDAVVQTFSRTKPSSGWNTHRYARCDTATLQRRYDVRSSFSAISTCLDLPTALSLRASDNPIPSRGNLVLTATLDIPSGVGGGRLEDNRLSGRTVSIQRRPPGSSSWTSLGAMDTGSIAGTYTYQSNPSITYEWRAVFSAPSDEGLAGSRSDAVTVVVGVCVGACPMDPHRQD